MRGEAKEHEPTEYYSYQTFPEYGEHRLQSEQCEATEHQFSISLQKSIKAFIEAFQSLILNALLVTREILSVIIIILTA